MKDETRDAIESLKLLASCAPGSLELAEDFLRHLPADIPVPDIDSGMPDDRAVSLEWADGRFSLDVTANLELVFKWQAGMAYGGGSDLYLGGSINPAILALIRATIEAANRVPGRARGALGRPGAPLVYSSSAPALRSQ